MSLISELILSSEALGEKISLGEGFSGFLDPFLGQKWVIWAQKRVRVIAGWAHRSGSKIPIFGPLTLTYPP